MDNREEEYARTQRAFDKLAPTYDIEVGRTFGAARGRGRSGAALRRFRPGDTVLDIGCGTGVDACRLARAGIRVIALDLSPAMLEATRRRAAAMGVSNLVEPVLLPAGRVGELVAKYGSSSLDGAYSLFGTLNLEPDLVGLRRGLAELLRPGAPLIAGLVNRTPLWEWTFYPLILRPDKLGRKLRRKPQMRVDRGRGDRVQVHYYSAKSLRRLLGPDFAVERVEAVNIFSPPPYLDAYARRVPRLVRHLNRLEDRVATKWPWNRWGYFSLVTLRRMEAGAQGRPRIGLGPTITLP